MPTICDAFENGGRSIADLMVAITANPEQQYIVSSIWSRPGVCNNAKFITCPPKHLKNPDAEQQFMEMPEGLFDELTSPGLMPGWIAGAKPMTPAEPTAPVGARFDTNLCKSITRIRFVHGGAGTVEFRPL